MNATAFENLLSSPVIFQGSFEVEMILYYKNRSLAIC